MNDRRVAIKYVVLAVLVDVGIVVAYAVGSLSGRNAVEGLISCTLLISLFGYFALVNQKRRHKN